MHVCFFRPQTALYNQLNELKRFIGLGQHNATDKMGYTPLHYAARNGHLDACKMLLNAGANVNAVTTSGGVSSLMRAAIMGEYLMFSGIIIVIISLLSFHQIPGHAAIVHLLLQHRANQFVQDNDGNTAIHKAAQNGKAEIVQMLADNCCEADRIRLQNIRNQRDETYADLLMLK